MRDETNNIIYELNEIIEDRFEVYAKYIIQERALPDVRDGLKPVQRRILYAMNNLKLFSQDPHKKSVRVVGEVIGKYHPHGDIPIYEAMVRMAQSWKLGIVLIDGHGNFGSIDGDSAAAMRYTEVRLSALAQYLLQDLDKKTVEWTPNFDDSEIEPTVLPAYFPNLLLNGCMGIAAGYATNMLPHNLSELISALIYRLNNPNCNLKTIMQFIKGPDLPTRGIIQGLDGIYNAYKTGKGKIVIRSKMTLEVTAKTKKWIINELPYEVIKSDLVAKIADLKEEEKIVGIKDVIDLSDMAGIHIEITLQPDADPELIRKFLLKHTNLQISYNLNMVVLEDNKPVCAGILNLLDAYINHQFIIIRRRTQFDLDKSLLRLEIVSGLIKVTTILDAIINTIRKSKNKNHAQENLIKEYSFSERQAEAIVSLRLYRLTSTDISSLKTEERALQQEIRFHQETLKKESQQKALIIKKLESINHEFSQPRKTIIEKEIEQLLIEKAELRNEENVFVTISRDGYIKVINEKIASKQDLKEYGRKPLDINVASFFTTTLSTVLVFTNYGNYCIIPLHKVKESRWKEIGYHINNFSTMQGEERVLGVILIDDFTIDNQFIILATKLGMIKRTLISNFNASRISKAFMAIKLQPNDEVIGFAVSDDTRQLVLTTKNGFVVRYQETEIAINGLKTKGVKAVNLKKNDTLVALNIISNATVNYVSFTTAGVKKLKVADIPLLNRPAKGVLSFKQPKSNPLQVITTFVVANQEVINILKKDNEITTFMPSQLKIGRLLEKVSDFPTKNVEWIQNDHYYDLRTRKSPAATSKINNAILTTAFKDDKILNENLELTDITLSLDDILDD